MSFLYRTNTLRQPGKVASYAPKPNELRAGEWAWRRSLLGERLTPPVTTLSDMEQRVAAILSRGAK
jgi:hypothetical protein